VAELVAQIQRFSLAAVRSLQAAPSLQAPITNQDRTPGSTIDG